MDPCTPTGLGEAFASYQPSTIDPETWQRLRPEFVSRFTEAGFEDWKTARPHVCRTAVFMADVLKAEPDATLQEALVKHRVEGYLERCKASGESPGTVLNRQGTLNRLLAGPRQAGTTTDSKKVEPYPEHVLRDLRDEAATSNAACAEAAVRLLDATLAGAEPSLSSSEIAATRTWLSGEQDVALNLRRLRLSRITAAVASRPALEVCRTDKIGRRALATAVAAVPPLSDSAMKELLRGG